MTQEDQPRAHVACIAKENLKDREARLQSELPKRKNLPHLYLRDGKWHVVAYRDCDMVWWSAALKHVHELNGGVALGRFC